MMRHVGWIRTIVGGAIVLLGSGCQGVSTRSGTLSAPAAPFLNDGSVVFEVVRSNLVAGRLPATTAPSKPLTQQAAFRIQQAASASNIVGTPSTDGSGQTTYSYSFDTPDGAWNNVLSTEPTPASATSQGSVDFPAGSVYDWQAGTFVATQSPPVGSPAGSVTTDYRVSFKVSQYGYTGSYRYVQTLDPAGTVIASTTDFDHVQDSNGDPVNYYVDDTSRLATDSSAVAESGNLGDGTSYQETVSVDASHQVETATGVCRLSDGNKVAYEVKRTEKTGLAQSNFSLPLGIRGQVQFTPGWKLSSGSLFDASGTLIAQLSTIAGSDRMQLLMSDGRRFVEKAK